MVTRFKLMLWQTIAFFFIGFSLINMGGFLNNVVINRNNCKMPVLTFYNAQTDDAIYTNDLTGFKFPWLADRFYINNMYYSIGDFIIFLGGAMAFASVILWTFIMIKFLIFKKEEENSWSFD